MLFFDAQIPFLYVFSKKIDILDDQIILHTKVFLTDSNIVARDFSLGNFDILTPGLSGFTPIQKFNFNKICLRLSAGFYLIDFSA